MRFDLTRLAKRAQGRYQRASAKYFCQRPFAVHSVEPIISFTFDDFPRSALFTGGAILQSFGLAGTYYAALGLVGRQTETGTMFLAEDLKTALAHGHELGCHTFTHCHSWNTPPALFEEAVMRNRQALSELTPGADFKTMSYPISVPRVGTKQRIGKYFACCRGGGQVSNVGKTDLNNLSAYFLEQSRDNPEAIKRAIDENTRNRGWLVFATHDVSDQPTRWGCTPNLFESIVRYSVDSGSLVLPVFRAFEVLSSAVDLASSHSTPEH